MTTAHEILLAGIGHMQDRAATYDKPEGERSMVATVAAFNAVTGDGRMDTEERGWLFQLLLKAVRSQQGGFKLDNYEDGAAYFGLAGEAASKERKTPAARHPMTPNVIEPADARMDIVARNGNDGLHYSELDRSQAAADFSDDAPIPTVEPKRPRHQCATCARGHATHQCTSGQGGER